MSEMWLWNKWRGTSTCFPSLRPTRYLQWNISLKQTSAATLTWQLLGVFECKDRKNLLPVTDHIYSGLRGIFKGGNKRSNNLFLSIWVPTINWLKEKIGTSYECVSVQPSMMLSCKWGEGRKGMKCVHSMQLFPLLRLIILEDLYEQLYNKYFKTITQGLIGSISISLVFSLANSHNTGKTIKLKLKLNGNVKKEQANKGGTMDSIVTSQHENSLLDHCLWGFFLQVSSTIQHACLDWFETKLALGLSEGVIIVCVHLVFPALEDRKIDAGWMDEMVTTDPRCVITTRPKPKVH